MTRVSPDHSWVLLSTGGTIAGWASNPDCPADYQAGQVSADSLLAQWQLNCPARLVIDPLAQVDSKDMDESLWRRMLARCQHWRNQPEVSGVIITHGTDTLEETAFLLHWLLPEGVPVVLTGAMRPSNVLETDGPSNLQLALDWLASGHAKGISVAFGGSIHHPEWVSKSHADRLDAFSSGDVLPLATRAPSQGDGNVTASGTGWILNSPPQRSGADWPRPSLEQALAHAPWPRVDVHVHHVQSDPWWLSAPVRAAHRGLPLRGVVLAATGHGTLNAAWSDCLQNLHLEGVAIAVSSRCAFSTVWPPKRQAGWHYARHLNAVKARIALQMACLAQELSA